MLLSAALNSHKTSVNERARVEMRGTDGGGAGWNIGRVCESVEPLRRSLTVNCARGRASTYSRRKAATQAADRCCERVVTPTLTYTRASLSFPVLTKTFTDSPPSPPLAGTFCRAPSPPLTSSHRTRLFFPPRWPPYGASFSSFVPVTPNPRGVGRVDKLTD